MKWDLYQWVMLDLTHKMTKYISHPVTTRNSIMAIRQKGKTLNAWASENAPRPGFHRNETDAGANLRSFLLDTPITEV